MIGICKSANIEECSVTANVLTYLRLLEMLLFAKGEGAFICYSWSSLKLF